MVKLKNALVAATCYVVAILGIYGLRQTVSSKATSHWGAGAIGRDVLSVGSGDASLSGGHTRHYTYGKFQEKKTGGSAGSGASAALTEMVAGGK